MQTEGCFHCEPLGKSVVFGFCKACDCLLELREHIVLLSLRKN